MDQNIRDKYEEVIGLEIHVQLLTNTKAYSGDTNEYGSLPNTNISAITLAHPSTLPKSNKKVVDFAVKIGLACKSEITEFNYYDRKNYFYPDLPKGYQLTQDSTPICVGGVIPIITKSGLKKDVILNRIHMEEDSGKSMHLDGEEDTLVDLNRAGTPLLEIVTEPCLNSSDEAYAFLQEVRKLVRYLDICDGNMEEGSMRCDLNVSIMLKGASEYGTKVEVKNMNSIRNVQRACEHEIERQILAIEANETIISETRLFDAVEGVTRGMRKKEELNDYRYFPEPDLQPVIVSKEWIAEIESSMPTLPNDLIKKFTEEYNLPEYDAYVLTDRKDIALYFEELCGKTKLYKQASNWVMGPVKSYLNELSVDISKFPLSTSAIVEILDLIASNKISNGAAEKELFPAFLKNPSKTAIEIAQELDLVQESDSNALQSIIDEVLAQHPTEVERYKAGADKLLGLFMGKVMKASKGKADPKVTTELLKKTLSK